MSARTMVAEVVRVDYRTDEMVVRWRGYGVHDLVDVDMVGRTVIVVEYQPDEDAGTVATGSANERPRCRCGKEGYLQYAGLCGACWYESLPKPWVCRCGAAFPSGRGLSGHCGGHARYGNTGHAPASTPDGERPQPHREDSRP